MRKLSFFFAVGIGLASFSAAARADELRVEELPVEVIQEMVREHGVNLAGAPAETTEALERIAKMEDPSSVEEDANRKSIKKADEAPVEMTPAVGCSILGAGERSADLSSRAVLFGLLGVAGFLVRRKAD